MFMPRLLPARLERFRGLWNREEEFRAEFMLGLLRLCWPRFS